MSTLHHVKYIGIAAFLLLGSISFTKTTVEVMKSNKRFEDLNSEVIRLEGEKVRLEGDLEYQVSEAFIEREAREKLNLIKPGEKIFVLDPAFESELNNDSRTRQGAALGTAIGAEEHQAGRGFKSNLQLWLEVF